MLDRGDAWRTLDRVNNREYLSVAETAAVIRRKLASDFAGTKFYVRSDSYAGGASIDIYYDGTDGYATPTVCHCSGGPTGISTPGDACRKCGYIPSWEKIIKPGAPKRADVEHALRLFKGKGFDGMIDLAYYIEAYLDEAGNVVGTRSSGTTGSMGTIQPWDGPVKTNRVVSFGSDYISVHDEQPAA